MSALHIFAKNARKNSVKTAGSSFVRIAVPQSAARAVLLWFVQIARTWKCATDVAIAIAQTACLFDSANVAIEPGVWIASHIGIVLNAGGRTVMNAHTSITYSGVKSARTNIVMIVVSRITSTETSIVRAVEGCCYPGSCTRKKY
jgi:hypothetical protein